MVKLERVWDINLFDSDHHCLILTSKLRILVRFFIVGTQSYIDLSTEKVGWQKYGLQY